MKRLPRGRNHEMYACAWLTIALFCAAIALWRPGDYDPLTWVKIMAIGIPAAVMAVLNWRGYTNP